MIPHLRGGTSPGRLHIFISNIRINMKIEGKHMSFWESSSSLPLFDEPIPPLSPLLLFHFPYLSLYNPFVAAFPNTTSAINDLIIPLTATRPNPLYDPKFSRPSHPGIRPSFKLWQVEIARLVVQAKETWSI